MQDITPPVQNVPTPAPIPFEAEKPKKKKKLGKILAAISLFLLLALFGAATLFAKSDAKVYLERKEADISIDFQVNADPLFDPPADFKYIPGKKLTQQFKSEGKSFTSTGTGQFGATKAKGSITMTNSCSVEKKLLKNSRIWWAPEGGQGDKYYRVQSDVTFTIAGTTGATQNVSLEAEQAGTAYNAPNSQTWRSFDNADGTSSNCINGAPNPGSIGGGQDPHSGKTPTAQDVQTAQDSIVKELTADALKQLSDDADSDSIFIEDLAVFKVTSLTAKPAVGEEGDKFTLDVTLEVTALIFDKEDLFEFLEDNITEAKDRRVIDVSKAIYTVVKKDQLATGVADLSLEGLVIMVEPYTENQLSRDVNFKNDSQIKRALERKAGVLMVEISSRPAYLSFIPKLSRNVKIVIITEEK